MITYPKSLPYEVKTIRKYQPLPSNIQKQRSTSILFVSCGDGKDPFDAELCVDVYDTWHSYSQHVAL
jgi:hypothetical protein